MIRKQCDKKLHEGIDKHTTEEGKHKVKTYYKPVIFLQTFEVQRMQSSLLSAILLQPETSGYLRVTSSINKNNLLVLCFQFIPTGVFSK